MSRECPYCGAELSDLDQFCMKCGLGTQAYLPVSEQTKPRKKNRFYWWLIPLILVLLTLIFMIVFWARVSLYLMPEVQLAQAMANTGKDLSARVEDSPVSVLLESLQWEEGYSASLNINLSVVGYDGFGASLSSAWDPVSGGFATGTSRKLFGSTRTDMVCADESGVVFSSDVNNERSAYSVPFEGLSDALDGVIFTDMEEDEREAFRASVEALRLSPDSFDREKLSKRYMGVLKDILSESRCAVEFASGMLVGDQRRDCGIVTYTIEGVLLAQSLEKLAEIIDDDRLFAGDLYPKRALAALELLEQGTGEKETFSESLRKHARSLRQDPHGEVTISFCLCEQKLAEIRVIRKTMGETAAYLTLWFGTDAARGEIRVQSMDLDGKQSFWQLQTNYPDSFRRDTLTVREDGKEQVWNLEWEKTSGALGVSLSAGGNQARCSGSLISAEDGFLLELPNALELLAFDSGLGMKIVQSLAKLDMTFAATKGAEVILPEGKPIGQWDKNDWKEIQNNFLR